MRACLGLTIKSKFHKLLETVCKIICAVEPILNQQCLQIGQIHHSILVYIRRIVRIAALQMGSIAGIRPHNHPNRRAGLQFSIIGG